MSGHAQWLPACPLGFSPSAGLNSAAVSVGPCGRRWEKLGTLSVGQRKRGGEKTELITVVNVKSALCSSDQLRGRMCGVTLSSVIC